MKFHDIEGDWSWFHGLWTTSVTNRWGRYDDELYEMDLRVNESSPYWDAYEFRFHDHVTNEGWYLNVTAHMFGPDDNIRMTITDEYGHKGYIKVEPYGDETENILLSIYDLIEGWYSEDK